MSKREREDQSYLCRPQPQRLGHQQGGQAGAAGLHRRRLPLRRHRPLQRPSQVRSRLPLMACVCACVGTHVCELLYGVCFLKKDILNEKKYEGVKLLQNITFQRYAFTIVENIHSHFSLCIHNKIELCLNLQTKASC